MEIKSRLSQHSSLLQVFLKWHGMDGNGNQSHHHNALEYQFQVVNKVYSATLNKFSRKITNMTDIAKSWTLF